jgi:hypothetical protein
MTDNTARIAYELFATRHNWTRPDGSRMPRWHELNQAARFRCASVAEVALHYEAPARAQEA